MVTIIFLRMRMAMCAHNTSRLKEVVREFVCGSAECGNMEAHSLLESLEMSQNKFATLMKHVNP
ncbi:MAG: hypothetical protein RMK18_00540 [Armatimonadota bacterium]|nr:hypothetical protein [Armatimonadota bacterium]MCX7776543.1 hypothetical protein [Armatimonadota bacterium]MDW8024342.1 hypothetical protein [Armatimonadota bacterium]